MDKFHIVISDSQRRILNAWAIKLDVANFGDEAEVELAAMFKALPETDADYKGGAIHDFTL